MPENFNHYSKEEMWQKLEPLFERKKDEKGLPLKDEKGVLLPSILEKMAANVIQRDHDRRGSPPDHDPLNYTSSDLAQDTVIKCLQSHKSFDPSFQGGANFPGWVKTVMDNCWKDKRKLKWPELETKIPPTADDEKDVVSNVPSEKPTPEEEYARKEGERAKKKCYEKLAPSLHKSAFGYRAAGKKLREIAELMRTSIGKATYYLEQAKRSYKTCIEDAGIY